MNNKIIIAVLIVLIGIYLMNKKTVNKAVAEFALSARSEARMLGVDNRLKEVVRRALELSPFDFGVTSGLRTSQEQAKLFEMGASQLDGVVKKSKHQKGLAIDFMAYNENGKGTWTFSYYEAIADAFKQASKELGIPIVWGGDWRSFKDGPHIELVA